MVGTVIPPCVCGDKVNLVDVFIRIICLNEFTAGFFHFCLAVRYVFRCHFCFLRCAGDKGYAHLGQKSCFSSAYAANVIAQYGIIADEHINQIFDFLAFRHIFCHREQVAQRLSWMHAFGAHTAEYRYVRVLCKLDDGILRFGTNFDGITHTGQYLRGILDGFSVFTAVQRLGFQIQCRTAQLCHSCLKRNSGSG